MTVRTVLFDLDGTLVDSLEDLAAAVNHVRNSYSLDALPLADIRNKVGKGSRNLIQQALPHLPETGLDAAVDSFLEYNEKHIADRTHLYPGIHNVLHTLRDNGIGCAVITNKNEALGVLLLKTLGVLDLFDCVTGGDTYSERKPSPLPLLKTAARLGLAPCDCIMAGDSSNDVIAARQAGIAVIGCCWGYGSRSEFHGVNLLVEKPQELAAAILKYPGGQP